MALTIPYLFFGMMASALNNSKQPEKNKMVLQASGSDARQKNKTL